MNNIEQIKNYFGRKRYYELRDEFFQDWLKCPKQRGVSTRYYINQRLQEEYELEMKQMKECERR